MRVKEAGNLKGGLISRWKLCAGNRRGEIPSEKLGTFGRYARSDEPGEENGVGAGEAA